MAFNFLNPYNFIPLGKECKRNENKDDGLFSGVINYSLLTKTPLFIPNTSNDHAILPEDYNKASDDDKDKGKYHKSYEFFSYEDLSKLQTVKEVSELSMPIIPGSEIRGLIRSNFEIITNSCFSAIDDNGILSKRTSEVFKAGLLKKNVNGSYDLYSAEDCLLRTKAVNSLAVDLAWREDISHNGRKCYIQSAVQEGQEVYVEIRNRGSKAKALITRIELTSTSGLLPGYAIKGEDGPEMPKDKKGQKHCLHIFVPNSKTASYTNIPAKRLSDILTVYDQNSASYSQYSTQWGKFCEGSLNQQYFPVYYSAAVSGYVMLSPASITREIYEKKLSELIGQYKTCNEKTGLCPACELFGNINDKLIHTSRVRVTDMNLSEKKALNEVYHSPVTLNELSSPKLNNMEFYLKRPQDALFWTYDYYIDQKGNIHKGNAGVNGRKFYWHNLRPNLTSLIRGELDGKERRYSCRPVNANNRFCGKIYFDKITKSELDRLIFILNSGEEGISEINQKKHGYKLGGGKPLGLGSVVLSVDSIILRTVELDDKDKKVVISEKNYDGYSEPLFEKETYDNFVKMTDLYVLEELKKNGNKVDYPRVEDGGDIYEWFTKNHRAYRNKNGTNIIINSPNSREQMVFDKYMVAMDPELKGTEWKKTLKIDEKSDKTNDTANNKAVYQGGKIKTGVITGHNKSGKFANVLLDEGGKASFFDNGKMETGTKVSLRYEGTESNGFAKWSLVK